MKPVNVYDQNKQLPDGVKVVTYAENQPEYQPLPCVKLPNGEIATKWELTKQERREIADNRAFYLIISTFNMPLQPLMPMADCPDIGYDENEQLFFYSPMDYKASLGIVESEDAIKDSGLPSGYRDAIHTDTEIRFSFWDRLKILFGWRVELKAITHVENVPGKCYTESSIHVYRLRSLPKGWGEVQAEAKSSEVQK